MPLKLKLIRNEGEIRRFSLDDERMRSFSLQSLHDVVHSTFPSLTVYNLYYFENGLFMEIATANDWERALRYAHVLGSHPLSIHVTTDIEQVRMSMFAPQSRAAPSQAMPSISAASLPVLGESSAPGAAQPEEPLEQRFFKFIETIPVVLQDGVKEVQRMVESVGQSAEEAIAEKHIAESLSNEAEEIKAHVNTFVEQVKSSVDQVKEQVEHLLSKAEPEATVVAEDEEIWEELPAQEACEPRPAPQADEAHEAALALMHPAACDECGERISVVRYKCAMCADYDLCAACEAKENVHVEGHLFLKISKPQFINDFQPLGEKLATISELDSKFIRDFTYPDGSSVTAGQNFDKCWVVKNTSAKAWPAGTYLQHVGGSKFPVSFASSVPAAQPGEEVTVSITLRAPAEEGKASGYFRLYHPIGQVGFGDRLWVDVAVEKPFPYNEALNHLVAMGYPEDPCRVLLEDYNGDLIKVIDQFR